MEPILGMINPWPLSWAPAGWALCWGQLLYISQNPALYSLLGTTYGGNGRDTFGLPDLRGRVPIGMNYDSASISHYPLGYKGGEEEVKVSIQPSNVPAHNHTLSDCNATIRQTNVNLTMNVSTDTGQTMVAANNNYFGAPLSEVGDQINLYRTDANNKVSISGISGALPQTQVQISGSTSVWGLPSPAPINIKVVQPYQVLNYIIATTGYYPTSSF